MHLHMPSVVLVPDTFLAGGEMPKKRSASTSALVQYIQEEFPGVPVEPVARRYWNEGGGEF
jgi:DNA mismatch repair protein MSH4